MLSKLSMAFFGVIYFFIFIMLAMILAGLVYGFFKSPLAFFGVLAK